jgi:hypothetical protein
MGLEHEGLTEPSSNQSESWLLEAFPAFLPS